MTKQLLIYEKVVPVSQERHLNWSVKTGTNYEFAHNTNSLPLMTVEFSNAAAEYTIIFTGNKDNGAIMPAIILGIRNNENLYLTETGEWKAKYIPAFVRRYPFVFSSNNEGDTLTLCIDENCSGFNQEGRGERLFDSQGERTQYLEGVLEFVKGYQAEFQRTQLFCKKLNELDLFEPMQASFTLQSGEKLSLEGFMVVNRDKLKSLTGEQLADLARFDELELIYLHLQSMRNFSSMAERLVQNLPQEESKQELEPA